jgi:hypothetical protein
MRNSRHTLIELSGNQRFVLAYVPTGSLYDVNEGDEVTIKTDFKQSAASSPVRSPLRRRFHASSPALGCPSGRP